MRRLVLALVLMSSPVWAQPGNTRRATNIPALVAYPAYYHTRPVVVVGDLKLLDSGEMRLGTDSGSIRIVYEGNAPEGAVEVRGEFWDLGRFNADDPRLAKFDLRRTFGIDPEGPWPRAGQVTALMANAIAATTPPANATIRSLVLFPERYIDQKVTVVGQFGGRNLLGDLPDAPGQSIYDFVVRSADAAIWVTSLRPRGKDFELSLDTRIDTGRWVELSGTLKQGRGLQWLVADQGSLKITQAPQETRETQVVRVPAAPPPEVLFSAPTAGETDVAPGATVRIQFSRDMDQASFRGRIRVTYGGAAPASSDPLAITTQYMPGNRVLEIRFANPLERFQTVKVELQDGVAGSDKQLLAPWTLTFETGGQ